MILGALQICRFCHEGSHESMKPMVRYSARSSAHVQCKLDSSKTVEQRREWILSLPQHQIERAIYMYVICRKDLGGLGFIASTLLNARDAFCENCGRSTRKSFKVS